MLASLNSEKVFLEPINFLNAEKIENSCLTLSNSKNWESFTISKIKKF